MLEKYFVFTGRPNAGKSSIIKEILGLNVTIGKRPGTTRRILKYSLSDNLVLVDMPGFGRMLGVSKRLENKVNDQIIEFLRTSSHYIALAVHVFDLSTFLEVTYRLEKKGFLSVDVEMVNFLAKNLGEFPLVAANKIDKADKETLEVSFYEFINRIGKENTIDVVPYIFPVSVKTGKGLDVLKNAIQKRLIRKGYKTSFFKKKLKKAKSVS
jgi:GTP-binding protein EngB required for normal cell division